MTIDLRRWAFALVATLAVAPVARAQGVFDMGGLTNTLSQDVLVQSERKRAKTAVRSNPKGLLYRPSPTVRQRNVKRLIERMRSTDPASAAELSQTFAKRDFFGELRGVMKPVGLNPNNLADAMAMYLVVAWYGVRGRTDGKPGDFRAVSAQIARAIGANPAISRASDETKQQTAESMMVYAVLTEQSIALAKKKQPETLPKIRAAIRQGAQATFGFDLAKMSLGPKGLH
jgi:hypothetical protein